MRLSTILSSLLSCSTPRGAPKFPLDSSQENPNSIDSGAIRALLQAQLCPELARGEAMDQSRRAVEAYWRSRMVDAVTSDEDKVAPVYKLEEVCELLRTSHAGIVKEVSDHILKRLDNKSPIVKQKALRLIKYAVGKSGVEFKREMQRHSVAMRQLFHYKGQPDPLKGDALNKAVRDTAHEAIAAIFAADDLKAPTESVNKRIEGFGNTNFVMPAEDKKSFLSEVVELGSASLKQGLSTFVAAHSTRKNDNGVFSTYKSPALRRSLTTEIDSQDRYEGYERPRESWSSSGISKDVSAGTQNQDSRAGMTSTATNEDASSSNPGVKSREERLLETIVTSGGVRLQPTRDALQAFLIEALKLDAVAMSHALEMKLQSPLWQVRMKAICVLESILRKKDEEHFSIIASYFSERRDSIVKCSELPQASLREKANKVLGFLDGEQTSGARLDAGAPSDAKSMPTAVIQMPDLIDTGDSDEHRCEDFTQTQVDQNIENLKAPGFLVDDLFGCNPNSEISTAKGRSEDDPFADVSFHITEDKESDIFSGLSIDNKRSNHEVGMPVAAKPDLLDVFSNSEQLVHGTETSKKDVHDLMSGLSLNGIQEKTQSGESGVAFSESAFSFRSSQPNQLTAGAALNGTFGVNGLFPLGPMQQNMPQNIMFNQVYATQSMNYATMGNFIAQQQLLFQNLGNLNAGVGHSNGNAMDGSCASPLPDIFQVSNNPVQGHAAVVSSPKKEETKAFDFISDHLSAARGSKRAL